MSLLHRIGRLERAVARTTVMLTDAQRRSLQALAAYAGDDPATLRRRERLIELAGRIRERRRPHAAGGNLTT